MKKEMIMLAVAAIAAIPVFGKIEMGTPFSDGVVLQRGMKVPVWGRATAGNEVKVKFAGQSLKTVADDNGHWRVDLEPLEASSESRTITVTESECGGFGATVDEVEIADAVVGEVWFASGQSNMECTLWGDGTRYRERNGGIAAQMVNNPLIRYVKTPKVMGVEPKPIKATWMRLTPVNEEKRRLSAVAFYYACELYFALGIPVGIVVSSWGGTNIDAWTPRCGYEGCDAKVQQTADYKVKEDWVKERDAVGPIHGKVQQPTVLFNGMVDAYAPMAMRGFIWYQGCHNSGESNYCEKMHALYNGWSRRFENPALRLYFAQLAPFTHNWMNICMAQNRFVKEQPNAAIAVTADIGNFKDIHPNDKATVAKRLAIHALKRDYDFVIPEDCSPVIKEATYEGGKVTMEFDHVKGWFVYAPENNHNVAFEVAGADGVWHEAKIVNYRQKKNKEGKTVDSDYIDGTKLVVASEKVAEPIKVRYMGKSLTMGTVYNQVGLPLGQFEAAK